MQGLDAADPAQAARPIEPTCRRPRSRALAGCASRARRLFRARRRAGGLRGGRSRRAGAERRTDRRISRGRARARRRLSHHDGRRRGAASRSPARARERLRSRRARPPDRRRDAAGRWVVEGAEIPPLVSRARARLFRDVDVLLAPATPCRAPRSGRRLCSRRAEMLVRPNIGLFTQPISFIGLPVCAVPVWTRRRALPIGVQIIGAALARRSRAARRARAEARGRRQARRSARRYEGSMA